MPRLAIVLVFFLLLIFLFAIEAKPIRAEYDNVTNDYGEDYSGIAIDSVSKAPIVKKAVAAHGKLGSLQHYFDSHSS